MTETKRLGEVGRKSPEHATYRSYRFPAKVIRNSVRPVLSEREPELLSVVV